MDGQRLTVEQVRCTADDLQTVDEVEGGFLRLQVDGEDGSGQRAELPIRQVVEGIVVEPRVVHTLNLRQLTAPLGEPERGLCLTAEADVERVKAKGFHIGHLRRHQRAEVRHQLCLDTGSEGQLLPHPLDAGQKGGRRALCPVELSVVNHQAAQPRAAARDILRARHHLDVNAKLVGMEGAEGHDGRVGYQGDTMLVGHLRQGLDVGHEKLRVGNDFEKECTGLVVNLRLHVLQIREVDKARLHAEVAQGVADERHAVAEKVLRGDNVQSGGTNGCEGIVDGGHTRVQGGDTRGTRNLPHPFLQIGDGGIGNAGIRGGGTPSTEGLVHGLCRGELKGCRQVDRHRECPIGIRLLVFCG